MKEKRLLAYETQPPLYMNVDGCQVTVYFAARQEHSILEDIKRMILGGLKK